MLLEQVWSSTNASTLLVLPLFNDLTAGIKTKTEPQVGFPFILLAYEYGLQRAYVFRKEDPKFHVLYLVFNMLVLEDLGYMSSPYYSLNELIVDSNVCIDVEHINEKVLYSLQIPAQFLPDIELIIQGKYSAVSLQYKEAVRIKYKVVPKWKNLLGFYLCQENMAFAVVNKSDRLRLDIEKHIGASVSKTQEYYEVFSTIKETCFI